MKSPQSKNDNGNYFLTVKKNPLDWKENLNKTVKIDECYTREQPQEGFEYKRSNCLNQACYAVLEKRR